MLRSESAPKPCKQFSAYLLAFLVFEAQVGVGLPGFQRVIFREAEHDAWLCVILAGLLSHITVWCMFQVLKRGSRKDLFGIQQEIFGRWVGGLATLLYTLYLSFGFLVILRNYVEMVQTWMFPDMPTWLLGSIIAYLAVYGVLGGVRVIVGICTITFFLTIWLVIFIWFPLRYSLWSQLLPLLEADIGQLLRGTVKMSFTLVGFELIYVLFPYIRKPEQAPKYTHVGLIMSTLLYLIVMVVTLSYFSPNQLLQTVWATFTMFKIVMFPFLERFEYVAISVWMLVILPNLALYLWASTKGLKRIFGWKQKVSTLGIAVIAVVSSLFLDTRIQIDQMNDLFSKISFVAVFIYPWLILLGYGMMRLRRRGPSS
ncbi:GerAB/ArcD/ProY family transporter [Paenibacillus silviterrae]|uniref:GerAB/ArcD/ProY family transporter n=1 Tax=Paenibacillus silviterrae TaxID=3242194 RepID=UPI00254302F5|nr:GerAB/ArcD/ProY family transporter [Paenibacillus chinjuensis]